MEEWLFNTVAFIGGPSEIKYWAELNEVFKILDVEMPSFTKNENHLFTN